jgi:hypothetical protein
MNTKVTKAQAAAVSEAANKLVDLIADIKGLVELTPEYGALFDKFVSGALDEIMPDATVEAILELLDKPEAGHH